MIAERFAPSPHSRWLHEDWRLWEGELPCSNREELRSFTTPHTGIFANETNGRTSDPLPADVDSSHAPFVTRGHHRDRLPSSLYELENACIDEESGRLYAFAGAKAEGGGLVAPVVKQHDGNVEYVNGFGYVGTDRLFSKQNRETVPIVLPEKSSNDATNGKTMASAWRQTIAASLGVYLRPTSAAAASAPSPAASVLYVEDTALMMPLSAVGASNPGHMYQRVAAAASQARLLGTPSILYLADYVSLTERGSGYASVFGLNKRLTKTVEGLEALLPSYLQANSTTTATPAHTEPTVVRGPAFQKGRVMTMGATPVQHFAHFPIHVMASLLAVGRLISAITPVTLVHPLHMSGERGCESMRCAGAAGTSFPPSALSDVGAALARGEVPSDRHCPVEEVADLRRCGRRHIAINVAPPIPYDDGFLLDTEGHPSEVWNGAVRETLREGRRVRADLLAATALSNGTSLLPPVLPPLPADAGRADRIEWYQRLWRSRLVSLIAHRGRFGARSIGRKAPDDKAILREYFADFMGAQLELRSLAAKAEEEATAKAARRPKQLVCYRSLVITHNHLGLPRTSTERGTLSIANVPTCHDAEGLKNAYESVAARFATCRTRPPNSTSVASTVSEPPHPDYTQANNTNRDAHPLFTLPPAEQEQLAASFAASQAAVEAVLSEAAAVVRSKNRQNATLASALLSDTSTVDLRSSAPTVAALLGRVEAAQRSYDEVLMDLFRRSPIRAYGAVRLKQRALLHTRSLFASLHGDKIGGGEGGRMADFMVVEAQEGMQAEGPAPRSLRAAQYRRGISADFIFGPHGADMHATAYMKPSALSVEIATPSMDIQPAGTHVYEYGFFSHLAYGRAVGYLRINSHSEPRAGDRASAYVQSTYLSLPEWRHTMATAVCSWLAFNAVRLADEAKAQGPSSSKEAAAADFSHLVPWWCRGGPIAVVEGLRAALRRERPDAAKSYLPSSPLTAHAASMRDTVTFLRRRSARSAFGFSVPNCPPLAPSVALSAPLGADGVKTVRLGGTTFGQAALNRLQTECARPVTRAVHDAPERQLLRAVEALQSHVEMARLHVDGTEAAALLSFLAVHGTGALLPEMPFPRQFWRSRHGEVSAALIGALLDGGASPDVPAAFRAAVLAIQSGWWEGISDARNAVPNAAPSPLLTNASAADRQFVLDFLRNGVATVGKSSNPYSHRPQDISATFSYGTPLKCPNPSTPRYFKKPCYGNWARVRFP